jgi:hypothetical protein
MALSRSQNLIAVKGVYHLLEDLFWGSGVEVCAFAINPGFGL